MRANHTPNWARDAEIITFTSGDNDFSAWEDCMGWLDKYELECGSMARGMPTAVCLKNKASGCIPKWYNLEPADIDEYIDGFIKYSRGYDAVLYMKKESK